MSRRDDGRTLRQMLDYAREIVDLARGKSLGELEQDRTLQLSLLHLLALLGEVARRLTPEARDTHPEIPWTQITGMRNWLIHAYDRVELETVWRAAQEDVPVLVSNLERILE